MQSLQTTTDLRTTLHQQRKERLARINEAAARQKAKSFATNVQLKGSTIVVKAQQQPTYRGFFVYGRAIGPMLPGPDQLIVQADTAPMLARRIVREICEARGITRVELMSDRRSAHLVEARQEAMWRISKEVAWSFPKIGRYFGRDHSTCIHAIRRHQARLDGTEYRPKKRINEAAKKAAAKAAAKPILTQEDLAAIARLVAEAR